MDFNEEIKNLIKESIQIELTKRGFHTPIISLDITKSKRTDSHIIEFRTEPFQTTPVLFKEITIGNSVSFVSDVNHEGYREFSIYVNAFFKIFTGGSNSTELFIIYGNMSDNYIFNIMTK